MRLLLIAAISVLALTSCCDASDPIPTSENNAQVFQKISDQDTELLSQDGALIMGNYFLTADTVRQFQEVDTLSKCLERIEHTDWRSELWTRQNADLTIRQRTTDYIETALEFYQGSGRRNTTRRSGKRLEKYTDTELGDRQLSSALTSVQMAAAWDIPLQEGQEELLNLAVNRRLSLLKPVPEGADGAWRRLRLALIENSVKYLTDEDLAQLEEAIRQIRAERN